MQEVLKLLEKKSVDINEKDKDGFTALAYTVASDDVKAISFLLSIGADPNIIVHNNASIFINSLIYNSEQTILALLKSNKLQNLKSADEAKALDLAKRRKLHKVEKKLKELSGKNSV